MAAEDINIKLNIDTSKSEASTKSLRTRIRELREEMAQIEIDTDGLTTATAEQRKAYQELEKQAGTLTDAMGDVQQRINQSADDYQSFSAALEATGALVAATQGFTGLAEQLGITSVGGEQLTKTFLQLQSQMNAINTMQKLFNKDSKLMQTVQSALNSAMTTGGKAAQAATVAQRGLNAAMKAAPYIAIATAIISVVSAIYSFVKANKEAAESDKDAAEAVRLHREELEKINKTDYINTLIGLATTAKNGSKEQTEYFKLLSTQMGVTISSVKDLDLAFKAMNAQTEIDAANERLKTYQVRLTELRKKQQEYYATKGAVWSVEIDNINKQIEQNEQNIKNANTNIGIYTKRQVEATAAIDKNNKALNGNTTAVGKNTESWDKWVARQKKVAASLKETEESGKSAGEVLNEVETLEAETAVLTAKTTEEKFNASSELLKKQEENEIAQIESSAENEEIKQAKIAKVRAEYAQKQKELEDDYRTKKEEADKEAQEAEIKRAQEILEEKQRLKQLEIDAITNATSILGTALASAQEAELAGVEQGSQQEVDIKKKYAISNLVLNSIEGMANLAVAIPKTLAAYAEIPFVGPALAAVQIAAYTASIMAQVAAINNMKTQVSKAARGAFVIGPSHSEGGVQYELEGGEAVLNKKAMAIPQFRNLASAMNEATGGVGFGTGAGGSFIEATISEQTINTIVSKVASIPVVVSEKEISKVQRKVNTNTRYSKI